MSKTPAPVPTGGASAPAYLSLGNYGVVVGHLRSRLTTYQSVPEPYAVANGTADFRKAVQAGLNLLPSRYHPAYVNVLARAVEQAQLIVDSDGLLAAFRRRTVLNQLLEAFRTLAAPIVQLQSDRFASELKAYLSVSSNLYQRFLGDDKIRALNKDSGLWPELDPLGFFSSDGGGPYTIVPSREMPLALVSKPVAMVGCLPLWVLDGHEVGGHGIHSILPDFTAQLACALEAAVADAFKAGKLSSSVSLAKGLNRFVHPGEKRRIVSHEDFFKHLAGNYALELAADMAGVLNLGPMFANGLILYFAATRKSGMLQSSSRVLEKGRRDAHPADCIRAMAAIEAVRQLGLSNGASYVSDLQNRLDAASTGETSFVFSTSDGTCVVTLPHGEVKALVGVLVEAALNRPLKCLADRSLKQVLTWSDRDEKLVVAMAPAMSGTKFALAEDAEARHVVAASLLAVEKIAHRQDFKRLTSKIQTNGITVLKGLYSAQCLLCAVPTYARSRRTETSLQDLLQRIRDARGD